MSLLTVHVQDHVRRALENMAAAQNKSLQSLVIELLESAVVERQEKARKRLLELIDASEGDMGPNFKWDREASYDRG